MPYRDRAGRITTFDGHHFADVYVATVVHWRRRTADGTLQWAEPTETLHGYERLHKGRLVEWVVDVSQLVEGHHFDCWDRGIWTLEDDPLYVEWLDEATTSALRRKHNYEGPAF